MTAALMKMFVLLGAVIIGIGIAKAQQPVYCPGQNVELGPCSDVFVLVWQGSALSGQCNSTNDMITIMSSTAVVGNVVTCGNFTVNVTDLSPGVVMNTFIVTTQLSFEADVSLNGTTVVCDDANPNIPPSVNQSLDIPATTMPTLMLSQVSQSTVGVMFVLDDARCVSSYTVNVTEENGPTTSVIETSSPVMVEDLDLCQYNYSFVGYTTSVTGEVSGVSEQVDLMVNLTVVDNLTVTINTTDPLIEWTHNISLYLSCITGYRIASNDLNVTVNSTVRSLTGQQLNTAGFPYCTTLHPTVTPLTPDHLPDLSPVMGSNAVYLSLIDPDFPMPILSFMFALNRSSADDSSMNDNTMNDSNSTNSSMTESNMNTGVTELVRLRIDVEDPGPDVEITSYNYIFNESVSSSTSFNGSYFYIDLPSAEGGDIVSVTVMFENGPCMSSMSADYTVPEKIITNDTVVSVTEASATVSIILPLSIYQPEELVIISTVDPPTVGPIMADFTRPAQQYNVTFTGLDTDTDYTFTIRIVLRSNNSVDAVPLATGMFMTLATTPLPTNPPTTRSDTTTSPPGTPAPSNLTGIVVGVVVGILVIIAILIVVVIIIIVCWWTKAKKSASVTITDHEMGTKLTGNNGDGASKPETPTPDSVETIPNPDVIPPKTEPEAADSAALIYADLDIGKKNKPKPSSGGATATSPTEGASGGQEDVQYADINFVKAATEGSKEN